MVQDKFNDYVNLLLNLTDGIIVLRGGGEVPREAHSSTVTRGGNVLWKNSRNCWEVLRTKVATAWLETASATAKNILDWTISSETQTFLGTFRDYYGGVL